MKSKKTSNYLLHFDEQVASDLEFDVVRGMLAEKCNQPTAEARAQVLRPRKDRKTIVRLLEETEELRRMRTCLLYTSPSPRDRQKSRMPSSA